MAKKVDESMVSIDRNKLLRFLDLIRVKGESENKECLLNFYDDKIECLASSSDTFFALKGKLEGSFNKDFGEIGMPDLSLFRESVASFPAGEINIIKLKNKLRLSLNNLKISLILKDSQYVLNKFDLTRFEKGLTNIGDNKFTLSLNIIKKINEYITFLKSSSLILSGKDNILALKLHRNENEILSEFTIEETVKPFTIKFRKGLMNILLSINNDVLTAMSPEEEARPTYVRTEEENISFEYLINSMKLDSE